MLADLHAAIRQLRRARRFTVLVVLTIALGVGAAAALFTAVDAVLLRPLPYREPERLVFLHEYEQKRGSADGVQSSLRSVSDWRAQGHALQAVAAYRYWLFNLAGAPQAEAVLGAFVTDNAFAALGVPAALGRTFRPGEDRPGSARVVVLSDGVWRRRFGADPRVVGRALRMDGTTYTVIGVMPPSFDFPATLPDDAPLPSRTLDVWAPAGVDPLTEQYDAHDWWTFARLAPGVTAARAADALTRLARATHATHPEADDAVAVRGLREQVAAPARRPLLLLFAAVSVLLAIACANVGGLLLARGTARAREVAVRLAVGATRGRIVRQLLAESVMLAAAGALAGLVLAAVAVALLGRAAPASVPRLAEAHVELRTLAFAVGVALATALAFGLAPAFHAATGASGGAAAGGLASTLRGTGRGATTGRGAARGRSALVVAQVALSLLLLAGAGLLVRSYRALLAEPLGFEPERVLTLTTLLPPPKYPDVRARTAYATQVVARVAALPSVVSAAAVNTLPLSGMNSTAKVAVDGRPALRPEDRLALSARTATPGYFRTLGIPVLAGRDVAVTDTAGAPPVVVVSRALATRLFPGESPLGRRLTGLGDRPAEIVGVVGDVRDALDEAPQPVVYTSMAQIAGPVIGFAVRTRGAPRAAEGAVRAVLAGVAPEQPVMNVQPMADYVAQATAARRFGLALTSAFAGVALGLSAVGLYGLLAYLVALRARDLSVRAALGASRRQTAWLVAGGALRLTLLGVALGAAAAVVLRRVVAGQLYGVGANDPVTFGVAAVVLAGTALAASAGPARQAARADPAAALRAE